jgi:NTE family protein
MNDERGTMNTSRDVKSGCCSSFKRSFIATIILTMFALGAAGQAAPRRPKIGLALSGGGAKGCAHVGVLRQLERMHIPVDYIAGTSMGSIVGALYASGMTPDEIEKELTTINWEEALSDSTSFENLTYRRKLEETRYPSTVEVGLRKGKIVAPAGIRTGQKLSFLLSRYFLPHLDERDFSKLPIPFVAVATDLETGEPFVLKGGDLAEAIRASMSIPGAFTPVEWEGKILVDGGVTMNVPVSVVREMGADIVIAVDIASPLGERDKLNSTVGVIGQLSSFLTRKNMEKQLASADLVLSPDIKGFDTLGFDKAAEIVKRGDAEAIAREKDLIKYSIDPAEHAALVKSRLVPRERKVVIDEIRVVGLKFVDPRFVRQQMKVKEGDVLDLDKLQKDIEWMYGWGDFIGIHAGLEDNAGKHTLVINVAEKPWGPAYVRTGIAMETRYSNPGVFLLLNYTRRWVNSRGAEWRNDLEFGTDWGVGTEFYQPRGYDKYGFVAGSIGYSRKSLRIYRDALAVSEYDTRQFTIHADGGSLLGTSGEVRLGLFQRWNDAEVEIGLPDYPTVHNSEGGMRLQLNANTTNQPFFPTDGMRVHFNVLAPLDGLGAEETYVVGDLVSTIFKSHGRHVFSGGLKAHDAFTGQTPVYDSAVLGGLGNLGGYPVGRYIGQSSAVASLGYRNRISKLAGLIEGVYAGVLAEAGNVSDSFIDVGDIKTSGTLFLGIDTSYGPLIVAMAKAKDESTQWYIQIGRSF